MRDYELSVSPVFSAVGDPARREDPAYLGHLANDGATCAPPPTVAVAYCGCSLLWLLLTMAVAYYGCSYSTAAAAVDLLARCASPARVEEYRSEAAAAANAVPVWVEGCHFALQAGRAWARLYSPWSYIL